jgi:arylsulfatase A-like enzyme
MAPGWRFDEILPAITRRAVSHIHERANDGKPFFLYFAMTSPHEPVAPSKNFAGKSGIAPVADFVMETDWSVGQVIEAVDDAGIADETIIIFTADNGHGGATGWGQLVKAGHQPSGQYRGRKGDIWEGGHRVPFVVRWPGVFAAGGSNPQLLCLNDLFATCAELLGKELPDNAAEDSFSFLQVPRDGASNVRKNLVSHSVQGEFSYREGPWKLIFKMAGRNPVQSAGKAADVQLYNLTADIEEKHNLAKQHPEIVAQLTERLQAIVDAGRSTPGISQRNDSDVRFDVITDKRWAPRLK